MVDGPCTNLQPANPPISVRLPDGSTIASTHTGLVPLPYVPASACRTHVFPSIKSGSLLSIGQLCDVGCIATFDKATVVVRFGHKIVTQGTRTASGLWTVKIELPKVTHVGNHLSTLETQTASDRIAFLHAAAGYPVLSTWIQAIEKGFYATWPGLTVQAVRRYLPKSIITTMGHLDQQRKNKQSTKEKVLSDDMSPTPTPQIGTSRTQQVYAECLPITGKIFSDLPGRFVVPSSRGNNYLLIVYDYDSNAIEAQPIKSRSATDIVNGFKKIVELLKSRGLNPQLHRLDNEASAALRSYLCDINVDYQLAPPHMHRRNAAERAIRTFKNHFVTILCGCDPKFPLHLWDRLVPQSILTLNLLRASRINPQLSAHAQLHGAFDFNRTPIGPLGTKVVVHEKPSVRESWAPHGAPAWYISPANEHYRCYKVYVIETGAERITDTLEWFPAHVPMPKTASIDAILAAARELSSALQNPAPATPFAGIDDIKLAALQKLAKIFQPPTANEEPPTEVAPEAVIPVQLPRVGVRKMTYLEATMNPGQRRRQQAKERNIPPNVEPVNTPPIAPVPTPIQEEPIRRSARIQQRTAAATANATIEDTFHTI